MTQSSLHSRGVGRAPSLQDLEVALAAERVSKLRPVAVRLAPEQLDALYRIAGTHRTSVARLLRLAVARLVAEVEGGRDPNDSGPRAALRAENQGKVQS